MTDAKKFQEKMPDLDFTYDNNFYIDDDLLPDPQVNPIIRGAKVPINKVGICGVDLPVHILRRDGNPQVLQAQASLYCSLDYVNVKGLNLSRLYLVMDQAIENNVTNDGIKEALQILATTQGSKHAYCKLRFKYPWKQSALRTRVNPIESTKRVGHIAYDVELEGQYHEGCYNFYLTVDYIYSSTCPCSYELAYHARKTRGKAANAHSQRSIAKVKVEYNPNNIVWIEDVVELCREVIPTEIQILVKRKDEQAFAELNAANLLFSEDAARLLYQELDKWYNKGRIYDFSVVITHLESLHAWNAIAVIYKGIEGGLR
ncbi:MAG: GTP cyclohydrolase FolE2 [Nitrosopumilaceae archaeon]